MISMPQPLTEQQIFLIPLLDKLRQFNSGIGTYVSSSMLFNFNYRVYLSNGEIIINSNLVADFIQSPAKITQEIYSASALQFVVNGSVPIITPHQTHRNHLIIYLLGILLLVIMITTLLSKEY